MDGQPSHVLRGTKRGAHLLEVMLHIETIKAHEDPMQCATLMLPCANCDDATCKRRCHHVQTAMPSSANCDATMCKLRCCHVQTAMRFPLNLAQAFAHMSFEPLIFGAGFRGHFRALSRWATLFTSLGGTTGQTKFKRWEFIIKFLVLVSFDGVCVVL